ncbi:substrate-binding periplasmic protein [Chitinilyticum piscinae]|uniref:Solute-binding protein family 3/N-terminal domain-containing protein n=1 Tax=Chitinilyticum piscinae TaxID=2866724 RepID=A0A8J7KA87_9NEIS|nr:transporter substrate-binding domain-containing protein [Chitinilyticum piscinae]MBE9608884.1 hypothetical protein [Chitinilyticum piscinae]
MRHWLVAVMLAWLAIPAWAAEKLTLCHEDVDVFPWVFGEKDGLDRYVMQTVARHLQLEVTYRALPWKRCQYEVREGLSDGMFSAAFSAERTLYAAYPMAADGQPDAALRMGRDRYLVFRKLGHAASWQGGRFVHAERAGIQAGYSIGAELRTQGLLLDERSATAEDVLRKLDAGSVDVAVLLEGPALRAMQQFPRWSSRLEALPESYRENDMFLALGRGVCQKRPGLCHKLWQEIRVVRESAEYRQLQRKYGL